MLTRSPVLFAESVQERRAGCFQVLLQPRGAIASATGPRLRTILVAAFAPVVCILHARQVKVFFPVRPFFLQRGRAVADFHPAYGLVGAEPRFVHVAQVFAFGNRTLAEPLLIDGLKHIGFVAGLNASSNQITHGYSGPQKVWTICLRG